MAVMTPNAKLGWECSKDRLAMFMYGKTLDDRGEGVENVRKMLDVIYERPLNVREKVFPCGAHTVEVYMWSSIELLK